MKRNKRKNKNKKIIINSSIMLAVLGVAGLITFKSNIINTYSVDYKAQTALSGEYETSATANAEQIDSTQTKEISKDADYIYLSDLDYTSQSKTGYGNIQKDKNTDGNTIKLRKEGEIVSYAKGMGFHANGQLIYDLQEYSDQFTRFIADIGVDASRPQVASIQVQVLVSDDLNNWIDLNIDRSMQTIRSADNCIKVDVNIKGKKYLKIVANDAGDDISSDHCVLGDAKIAKADYDTKSELYSEIETLSTYDNKIREGTDIDTVYDDYNTILKREFINKFGYWSIQNYCKNETLHNAINWILNDQTLLEYVIEVGEISDGNTFFEVLGNLHIKRNSVLQGQDKELYERMMVGLAAAYSTDFMSMATGFSIVKHNYDYVERFDIMKDLYHGKEIDGKTYRFEYPEQFKKYHVDLIRNIMNIGLRNDEILWMNYHSTTKTEANKYNCHAYLAYKIPVYKDDYYNENFRSFYDDKYNLEKFGVPFADGKVNRDWMIIDNGGVCWNISRIGQAVFKANGIPAVGLYQPGHEPFMNYTEVDGKGVWKMQYNVGGWGKAGTTWGGGGRYRLTFDWGNKYFSDQNVGGSKGGTSSGYEILAQANLNDYDNYKKSLYYNLLANSFSDINKKEEIYMKALSHEKLNLDSYEELINIYKEKYADKSKESGNKWCDLAEMIIKNYTYYPNALHDLMGVIMPYIEEIAEKEEDISAREFFIRKSENEAYQKACNSNQSISVQSAEIMQIASRYINKPEEIATFSFDGDHGNQIVLNEQYLINYQYSVDYDESHPENATWSELSTDKIRTLTVDELKKINSKNDIVIKMTGTDNKYKIDIEEAFTWQGYFDFMNYYNNDLENVMCEAGPNIEWCYIEDDEPKEKDEDGNPAWKSFEEEMPNLTGDVTLRIRLGRSGNCLASELYQDYKFTADKVNKKKKYIPISEVNFAYGTDGAEIYHGDYAINGNYLKGYASSNLKDKEGKNCLVYELSYPRVISAVDYIPDCENYGQMKKGKILGSKDGETWFDLAELNDITYTRENLKSFINDGCSSDFGLVNTKTFEVPDKNKKKVRFIKIVAEESTPKTNKDGSSENIFSARMFNFYEDTEFVTSDVKGNPEANIVYSTMETTKNSVEAKIVSRSSEDVKVVGDEYTHTFTSNGTYTFNLKDSEGRTGKAVANVTWIDNEAEEPDVKFSTDTPTNGEVEAILVPTEDIVVLGSGFSVEDEVLRYTETNSDGKQIETVCKDFSGELSSRKNKDFYIDEDGSVVVTTNGEISKRIPNKVEDAETGVTEENVLYKHKFLTNDTYKFEYVDMYGNIGEKEVRVGWIDNTPPTGMITYSTTSKSEDPVTATISFTDENGEEEEGISILNASSDSDDISYEEGSNKVIFNKNGKFMFEFKDQAGNVSEAEAKVTWIEKILDSTEYKIKNKEVKNVPTNTTVSEFKGKLKSQLQFTIVDSKNELVEDGNIVTTGMKVSVNGNSYEIIVQGDVDSDGMLTTSDIEKMCDHFLDKEALEGIYLEAGDYDNNNEITLVDVAKMYSLMDKGALSTINKKLGFASLKAGLRLNDELTAYISLQDLQNNINAIGGELTYDKEHLTLTKVESENSEWKVKNNADKIIALRKNITKSDEVVIKLTFKIKTDTSEISASLNNFKISDGTFEKDAENALKIRFAENTQKIPVESIEIGSTSDKFRDDVASLEVTDTISFHATILPEHATETNVNWSLVGDAGNYISIDQNGTVTANKITGEEGVKIRATVDGVYDECTIKVIPTEVTGLSDELVDDNIYLVEPNTEETGKNTSVKIVVNVLPDNATNKELIWESSDTSVATVEDGVITVVPDNDDEEGTRTCTITVTSVSNPQVSKQYTVHVNDHLVKVTNVDIELQEGKTDNTIILGETLELKAKIIPENANFKDIRWSVVEGEDVIEVSSSGHVHTIKEGDAKVRVTVMCQSSSCPEHTAEIIIKVLPKSIIEVTNVEIQGEKSITLKIGTEMKLHAMVSPDDATDKTVIWESSNNDIVTVTDNGLIFAERKGTATITAKSGNALDSITVNVEEPLKTDLTVYVMNHDNKFINGMTMILNKILSNVEIKIDEQQTNGKFNFKDLEDGEYIIHILKPLDNKPKAISEDNEIVAEYRFKVENGKILFNDEDGEKTEVNSLVFTITTDNKVKVENSKDYPNIEQDYQEFIKNLSNNPDNETKPGDETNPGDGAKPGDETNPGGGNSENETNPGGVKPGDESNPGGGTSSGDEINSGEEMNLGGETNSNDSNTTLYQTSDISIEKFKIMMITSFIGIIYIINIKKKIKSKKRKHMK